MLRTSARLGALLTGIILAGCSIVGGKAAEEPGHRVVVEDGDFEIRDYPAIAVARTTVTAEDRGSAVREGFGRLFDYISGANVPRETIAMTAPVLTEKAEEGAEIAMTAPVLSERDGRGWTVSFVLPEGMTEDEAPVPADERVRLATIPERQVGVVRFAGLLDTDAIEIARARLDAWLARQGRAHRGDWQAAGYNPPWTIPALRRNEVMVTIEAAGG